ncbi:MAG TPA: hypothetical protein VEU53_09755 [Stellaceae bacterium]|nr:hypothetical protein [Stellaceae bacterium]
MRSLLASKSFRAGVIVALGIGIVACVVSWSIDLSAHDTYTTASVRL